VAKAKSHPVPRLGPWGTAALLYLHLHAGLRASEAYFITWKEIDFMRQELRIAKNPYRQLKTRRARRTIPMTPALFGLLDIHHIMTRQRGFPNDDLVFANRTVAIRQRTFTRLHGHPFSARKKPGAIVVPWAPPQILRRTFLSALWSEHLELPLILDISGHSSVSTTLSHYIGAGDGIPELDPAMFGDWAEDAVLKRRRTVEAGLMRASGRG